MEGMRKRKKGENINNEEDVKDHLEFRDRLTALRCRCRALETSSPLTSRAAKYFVWLEAYHKFPARSYAYILQ